MRFLLGSFLMLALAGPAFAQPAAPAAEDEEYDPHGPAALRTRGLDDEAARSAFRVGQLLYEEGRFEEAGREFERSYELSRRGSLLFNAYLAYRDAGLLSEAARVLAAYLTVEPDAENADQLANRLRSLEAQVEAQEAADAEAEAERQRLEAERERLQAERQQALAEAEAAREEDQGGLNPLGFIVGGVGVAMLGGGVAAGVIASGEFSDIEDACPNDVCAAGFDLQGSSDRVGAASLAADILLFGGAAVTIAGIGLLFLERGEDDPEAPATTAGAACGPFGCTATVMGRF
ncbi:MAG: hypothetical protein AAGH15_26455 [Myxococcota bacterium]